MKFKHFVGIDISKASFDVALCHNEKPDSFFYSKFSNTKTGCKQLINWLKKAAVNLPECFFIMEHTGRLHGGWYTLELCCFLQEKKLPFSLFSPLHLKRSLGLARGKNDRVDARRLAYYGFLHRHEPGAGALKPMQFPSSCLLKLKNLFAFRERLIKSQASLKQTIADLKDTLHLIDNSGAAPASSLSSLKSSLKSLKCRLKRPKYR